MPGFKAGGCKYKSTLATGYSLAGWSGHNTNVQHSERLPNWSLCTLEDISLQINDN